MQPFPHTTHPSETPCAAPGGYHPDGPTVAPGRDSAGTEVGLRLRLAQRAFAALIEASWPRSAGVLSLARLRRTARRTLSGLSADDRSRLSRWLSLQMASASAPGTDVARMLAAAAPALAAHVDALLARTREELSTRSAGTTA